MFAGDAPDYNHFKEALAETYTNENNRLRIQRAFCTKLGRRIEEKCFNALAKSLLGGPINEDWLTESLFRNRIDIEKSSGSLFACAGCGISQSRTSKAIAVSVLGENTFLCVSCYGKWMALRNLIQHLVGRVDLMELRSLYKGCRVVSESVDS